MNAEGGPVTVLLLIGSSFFLVSSFLATAFPPLAFVSPLWAPFRVVSSSYLALAACLWSLTVLSFYLTERVSSGDRDAYIPLVPAVISALLFLPIAVSVVGVAGLSGTAFCAFSFAVAVAGYRARVGVPA